jgi:hypothetical protein
MKQFFCLSIAIGLATNAQSIPIGTTTTFAVNSKEDVKHIVHAGTVSPDEMYSFIDYASCRPLHNSSLRKIAYRTPSGASLGLLRLSVAIRHSHTSVLVYQYS